MDHHLGAANDLLGAHQLRLELLFQPLHRIGNSRRGKGIAAGALGKLAGQFGHVRHMRDGSAAPAAAGDAPRQPDQRCGEQQAQRQRPAAQRLGDEQQGEAAGLQEKDGEQARTRGVHEEVPLETSVMPPPGRWNNRLLLSAAIKR
ncbi:hypothetical protein D3C76_1086720 [compost metagenome]